MAVGRASPVKVVVLLERKRGPVHRRLRVRALEHRPGHFLDPVAEAEPQVALMKKGGKHRAQGGQEDDQVVEESVAALREVRHLVLRGTECNVGRLHIVHQEAGQEEVHVAVEHRGLMLDDFAVRDITNRKKDREHRRAPAARLGEPYHVGRVDIEHGKLEKRDLDPRGEKLIVALVALVVVGLEDGKNILPTHLEQKRRVAIETKERLLEAILADDHDDVGNQACDQSLARKVSYGQRDRNEQGDLSDVHPKQRENEDPHGPPRDSGVDRARHEREVTERPRDLPHRIRKKRPHRVLLKVARQRVA
mmetsp:Transcript_12371/g.31218  ORF Transcript_12371/g.31218 Transcript_12371/m.31218 type:complete len:307 (-) Transcript_12371:512-1432(-)